MTQSGQKFGLLVIPSRGDDGREIDLTPGRSWLGRVADIVEGERVAHWREWLGSVRWEEMIERKRRLVLVTMPSSRPDVLDQENETLNGDLYLIWRALLLAGPRDPLSGEAWFFSGQADPSSSRLLGLRGHGTFGPVTRPFYASRRAFWRRFPRKDPDSWLDRWAMLVGELRSRPSVPHAIGLSFLSFEEGHRQEPIEFRLPSFVRAAEAVVALHKGAGATVFADRIMKLAPELARHWHLGVPDLRARLESLYQHRNDCVHGKVPFLALREQGDAGQDTAAWYEHLAEAAAREALLFALRSPALLAAATDRVTLENAWKSGALP